MMGISRPTEWLSSRGGTGETPSQLLHISSKTRLRERRSRVACVRLLGTAASLPPPGMVTNEIKMPWCPCFLSGITEDTKLGSNGSDTCHCCMQEEGSLDRLWRWISAAKLIFEFAL
jgi:hypothetical protein